MTAQTVTMTDRAANHIAKLLAAEPSSTMLRVSVESGGCSGYQYKFDLVAETASNDTIIERKAAKVVIDPASLEFLAGSEIDYVQDLIHSAFKIQNPTATASCGCGTSFAVS